MPETISLPLGDDAASKAKANEEIFAKLEKGARVVLTGFVKRVWEPNDSNTVIRVETATGMVFDALCGGVLVEDQVHPQNTKVMMQGLVTGIEAGNNRVCLVLERMDKVADLPKK